MAAWDALWHLIMQQGRITKKESEDSFMVPGDQ